MQILSPLPDGVVYAGWNRDPFLSGAAVTGIHYPEVSYRRISFGTSIDATEPIPPITPQNFIGVSWDQGITEPGSSGSPLLNSSHQIVGTLTGGYSTCALPHAEDDFGRFEISAPQMIYQIPGTPNYINLLDNGLPDDPLAPNQSRNQATNIPYILNQWNNLNPLVLKWQHDDWFHIAVPVNGFVNGYLNVPNPNQGDVQIEIFRDSDLAPSISSTSTMQGDQLSFTYTLPQDVFMHDYYIHVFLANGQRLDYNLNHLFLVQPPDPILVTNPIPAGSFPNITVSGTIDPKGYAYNVYLLAAPCTNIDVGACQVSLVDTKSVNGNNVVTLQGVVPNIQPCYSYYYRIRTLEYNTQKELEGGVYSFHTDGPCVTFNLPIFYNIPTLDFGPVLVGLSSTRSITISNTGNQPLIINDIDFWDDRPIFVIQNNCPGTLNIDNSCNVQVTFTPPDKIWFYSESFNIHHNSTFGYSSVTMQGYGTDWNITTARPTREHLVGSGISPGQSEELSFSAGLSGPGTADIQLGCTGAPAGVSCEVSPSILHIVNGQQTVPVTATVHIAPRRSRRLSSNEEGPGNSASAPPPGAYHLKLTARIGNVMKTQDVLVTVLQ